MPKAVARELKPLAERSTKEKIAGLTKLKESLERRRKATVERMGTDMPTNPSDRAELTSLEERMMYLERDLDEYHARASDEQAFESHLVATRRQRIDLLSEMGDLEAEDHNIEERYREKDPTPRQIEIRARVEELYKKLDELH